MKRPQIFSAALLASLAGAAGAAGAAGVAAAQPAARAHAAHAPTVQLRHTHVGTILANGSGHTLYEFTHDATRSNSCVKIRECAHVWPALQSAGRPTAGPGVNASLLSTITLAGGVKQVTYAGHALYLYSGDTGAGETGYVGVRQFGGTWDAVNAAGHMLK